MVKDLCFEIIDKCPNKCKFCSSNSCYAKNTKIEFRDFKRVICYFMSEGGIEELSFSGGEPFLHPDLFQMVEYSKSLGIRVVIFTSGVKIRLLENPEVIQQYKTQMVQKLQEIEANESWNDNLKLKIKAFYKNIINPPEFSGIIKAELFRLKELGLDKIVFDFQAYEHDTDSLIMGRDRYKHSCLLDSLINASSVGIETDVHFIPMKLNYREIGDILELLEIAGINNISILNFVPQGRGVINKEKLMLSSDELDDFMELINNAKINFPVM